MKDIILTRMTRKKRVPMGFVQRMLKYQQAGVATSVAPNSQVSVDMDETLPVNERVKLLMGILDQRKKSAENMLFFVMYDIENNKVRVQISKYLEKKGCIRIQKSIFLANVSRSVFDTIRQDLAEVQACYDNKDSILIVPISSDYLESMKIIGQDINLDLFLKNKNTLFF